jgi:hypothetical protein
MAKEISRVNDPIRKIQIVTFEDEYGARMVLQHPLTIDGYDPQAREARVIALMDENVRKYRERIAERS